MNTMLNIRASLNKIDSYFYRFYDNMFSLFILVGSLLVGIASSALTKGKVLNWNDVFRLPSLDGLAENLTGYCVLILFFGMIYCFSSALKLRSISFRKSILLPAAIHAALWEGVVFYLGLFGVLSILFKFIIPTEVLTNDYPQVFVTALHYFSIEMPIGINLSLLIAVLITNLVFAFAHASKIVLDGGIRVYRVNDLFHGLFSLILSKSLFATFFSYGFFCLLIIFGLFIIFQLLISRLILVIKG